MPFYNPVTDKIENCEEGTIMWWHERGHQVFFKNWIVRELYTWQEWLLVATLGFLCVDQKRYALISLAIFLIWMGFVELWAWGYAILIITRIIKEKEGIEC